MRFARPELLWLLLLAPLLAVWLGRAIVRRRRALASFTGGALRGRLVTEAPVGVQVIRVVLRAAGVALLVLAAARPQWGTRLEQVSRQGVDVVVAIDISESMLAEDLKPSRLLKAREETARLLERLQGDRVGLVGFAGSAGVLCPLTLDYNAVRIFLDALEPGMISYPGSSLASAIRAATGAFGSEERKFKVLVLFTDGESHDDAEEVELAAQEAAAAGLVIHAVGVATPAGEPIPIRDRSGAIGGYKQDAQGRVVVTRLEEAALARVAEATGGRYFPATATESELDRIAEAIAGMDKKEMQARLSTQFEEQFQLPLALALAALLAEAFITLRRRVRDDASAPALARRGGVAAALALACAVAVPAPALAQSVPSLVEEGNRLYREGRLAEAMEKYLAAERQSAGNPAVSYNIGNVLYRQGEFQKAYERYRQAFPATERALAQGARFNAGNAHFAQNQWRDAITNYREALRLDPADRDAKKNLELALLAMQQEEQRRRQQQQQNREEQDPDDEPQEQNPQQQPSDQDRREQDAPRPDAPPKERPSPEQEKQQLSKQEAMRMLDALKDQDKPPRETLKAPPPDRRPEKDW
ncbi:MAG TPA: VWA domain-containing protein [Candidatus Polarisedimenticolia bacterium]|nr:VWA domain-containing protein [Candidatus Polarisedimenticolia bacterium]